MTRQLRWPGFGAAISRRGFVQGLLATSCGSSVIASGAAIAAVESPEQSVSLTIGPKSVRMSSRTALATAINDTLPGPCLRLHQGSVFTAQVTNNLSEPTSIHWHGIRLPSSQDGVPGLSFAGIAPGATFTYRFPIIQSGTYWYHSHSGMQEQTGVYGPLILIPQDREPYAYERDYVVMLSDWTDEDPMRILSNLKQQNDYYDMHRRTMSEFADDISRQGLRAAAAERGMWGRMRMSPTDLMDVSAAAYQYLVNGHTTAENWTGEFQAGERVRLRFINASSMTTFDVRIPELQMTLIAADGTDIEPVAVDEFRIGVAETYDVIVQPANAAAYTIFAQTLDRSGYARATLAPPGVEPALVPAMDRRPVRTMTDMGMQIPSKAPMADMNGMDMSQMDMSKMNMNDMMGMTSPPPAASGAQNADHINPAQMQGEPSVDHIAVQPTNRLTEAGDGLDGNGRRVLRYSDLRALIANQESAAADRDLEFRLTGNMERWIWGFDGKKFSESEPIRLRLGERIRFILVNDTMMEHPIHLHGFLFELENGQAGRLPIKHTVNVKPNERLSFLFTADTPGYWAFHCHLMLHMDTGMFRTVAVA